MRFHFNTAEDASACLAHYAQALVSRSPIVVGNATWLVVGVTETFCFPGSFVDVELAPTGSAVRPMTALPADPEVYDLRTSEWVRIPRAT